MRKVLFAVLGIGIGALAAYFLVIKPMQPNPRFEPLAVDRTIPHASARGRFKDGRPVEGMSSLYEIKGAFPGLSIDAACGEDLIIVVHGFNNSPEKALNRFGVAQQALQQNGYKGSVVGFSWDADTQLDPFSATGYRTAKAHTEGSGPALAALIDAVKFACPDMKVRLIGYSMGARLALEALLHGKSKVDAIYLVGAAVDNEEVEIGERYGRAIEGRAGKVVNYFSPEDSKLGSFFALKEGDRALGKHDIEHRGRSPRNFRGVNVAKELPEVDKAGEIAAGAEKGKNHSGYLGTRNDAGKLTDDGVMNLIAADAKGN